MSGLTPQGFEALTTEEVFEQIADQLRAQVDASVNVGPDSILGHLVGILAERLGVSWDLALSVYRSAYPDSASGEALDQVCAITGVVRLAATRSRADVIVTGTPGTILPAGRVVSVDGTGARFRSLGEVTIGEGGTAPMEMESEALGPIVAVAGSLTKIETPVSGWASVTNPLDATPGRRMETDTELRLRREQLLRATGTGTLDAIRAGLLEPAVPGVSQVRVFENTTLVTDVAGVPGKSFEAIVEGGDAQAIRERIWQLKPAGILAHGSETGDVVDSLGFAHPVAFSRPVYKDVWISVEVETGDGFPLDGVERIKAALAAKGRRLLIGEDVIYTALFPPVFSVPGIVDVTALTIGLAESPVGTSNIAVGDRELARFDTSRIVVVEA